MITAATRAKIAMQITVTNQKTKSIRPACRLAGSGSQGMRIATRAAPPPQTIPMATSWATDPLRTRAETTRRLGPTPKEAPRVYAARNACNEAGFRSSSMRVQPSNRKGGSMGLGVSILLVAAGAILAWAVNADVSGVNIHTVGWILLVVGIVGAVLSMIFWSTWAGPGYWSGRRRGGYVDEGPPPY